MNDDLRWMNFERPWAKVTGLEWVMSFVGVKKEVARGFLAVNEHLHVTSLAPVSFHLPSCRRY